MNPRNALRRIKLCHGVSILFLLLTSVTIYSAEPALGFNYPPGSYAQDIQLIPVFPDTYRSQSTVNGEIISDPRRGFFLSCPEGEERSFAVTVRIYGLSPDSPVLLEKTANWTIDKRPPEVPILKTKRYASGMRARLLPPEPGDTVKVSVYSPYYDALSRQTSTSAIDIDLREGEVLSAITLDQAGNRGSAVSYEAPPIPAFMRAEKPYKIISPVQGDWSNRQSLYIEGESDLLIRYTTDGTDPSLSGLLYTDPVLLDSTGVVVLSVHCEDSFGSDWNEKVVFTVTPSDSSPFTGVFSNDGIIQTGTFSEITIPENLSYVLGEGPPYLKGGRSILFSSMRSVELAYPLAVTDGQRNWRWLCVSGTKPIAEIPQDSLDETLIHDWHFVSVEYAGPVYYRLGDGSWNLYTEPVLVKRLKDELFTWYSQAKNNGDPVQISLPAKPKLTGFPASGVTAEPFLATVSRLNVQGQGGNQPVAGETHRYAVSSSFYPPHEAGTESLESGLLFEIPQQTSQPLTFRVQSEYGGRIHGYLYKTVLFDRKPPRTPSSGLQQEYLWSRDPVSITPSGEDTITVDIKPSVKSEAGGQKWILPGSTTGPIDYTVTLYATDAAGNKSPRAVNRLTVDLNALYVDGTASAALKSDGSPENPFPSLDEAVSAMDSGTNWRLYVRGPVSLSVPAFIRGTVSIVGDEAQISCGGEGMFIVNGGNLSIDACSLVRTQNNLDAPLFDLRNGTCSIRSSLLATSGGSMLSLIRSVGSNLSLEGVTANVSCDQYAVCIDAKDSVVTLNSSSISLQAQNTTALSVMACRLFVKDSTVTLRPSLAGRIIEAWSANLSILGLECANEARYALKESREAAVWHDSQTKVLVQERIGIHGFSRVFQEDRR